MLEIPFCSVTFSCTHDNVDSRLTSDEKDLAVIEIIPEYQHILSWSWNTLRFSADILARWAVIHAELEVPILDDRICDQCFRIGYLLLHILLHCRHRVREIWVLMSCFSSNI
ncbi:hypothetical protein P879_12015 [Paragonimus westermani]|uniref:Uncharacterized protein n=1 Tax=Paragonimus westermani TaxID=34504 RepID=A0A8T0D460_9TREM|nr:hypothetical protein P879_12015 [Paragonimus westermani]